MVIVNTFGLYTLKIDAWSLISDIHSSIVLQISCIIILIVHTYCSSLLCSKHIFFCLISRLYLLHKIRYATLVFFYCKKQMTVIGDDIIGNSPVYTCTLIDCATTHWNFFISYIFIILDSSNEKAVFLRCFKVWKLWLFYETMPLLKEMRNVSCSTARRLLWNH